MVVVKVDASEGYVRLLEMIGALVSCTLMVAGEMVGTAVAAGENSSALAAQVSEMAALAA